MPTILVTGGAGFLGSHLCDRLIDRGDEVICVDNFFTGRKANIQHLIGNSRFELIRHDIVFPLVVECDQIYNLACPASPIAYQFNPIKTIKTSTVGIVNMLGLAKRCRARFLQASTSEVYGDGQQTRSFCYRDDLIEGMIRLMDNNEHIGPVNIGNPDEKTMLELAQAVIAETGSKSELKFEPLPKDDPKQRCPDITRARNWLGWEPQVPLNIGLAKTVEYYRQLLAGS